jgi:hypothetical protein
MLTLWTARHAPGNCVRSGLRSSRLARQSGTTDCLVDRALDLDSRRHVSIPASRVTVSEIIDNSSIGSLQMATFGICLCSAHQRIRMTWPVTVNGEGNHLACHQATPRIVTLYRSLNFNLTFVDAPRRINCTGDRTPAPKVLAFRNLASR